MGRPGAASAEEPFVQAIIDRPDDDLPRLIFADWLQERGDPRGEFIRLQCRRAKLNHTDPAWKEMLTRETGLIREYEADWAAPVLRLVDGIGYHRGFIEHVSVTASKFLKNADRLFRVAPVASVKLTRLDLLPQIAACPHLARVQALDLSNNRESMGSRTLRILLQSPHLTQLRTLDLSLCELSPIAAEVLAGAANLAGLHTLILECNSALGEEGARTLAAAPHLANLRELNLRDNGLLCAGAARLGTATFRLTHLNLAANRIGNDGITALAASGCFGELRRLELQDNIISSVGVEALTRCPHLRRLEHLDLGRNRITDRGAQALATATTMPELAHLHLQANEFGPAAAKALAASPNFPRMRSLALGQHAPVR